MRIGFYAPLKPLGHGHPSGDLAIAAGLATYLAGRGHDLKVVSSLRARWIYWHPWRWFRLLAEYHRAIRHLSQDPPDLWLTYHPYYKAPDLLGPGLSRRLGIPYVIFQGMYSTKRRRSIKTWPGFMLNREALCAARYVFTNRCEDQTNLARLLPPSRVGYVAPGIQPGAFEFDQGAGNRTRSEWQVENAPVVLSAAMFRPGVKTRGLEWVINACADLARKGMALYLMIAGDGKGRTRLMRLAERRLAGRARFVGKIPREEMYRFYSAGDIFAFPGIRESLGMVYLEAQACGIPVVAFENGGIPEVVKNGETGFLTPAFAPGPFLGAIETLLERESQRKAMGQAARTYVAEYHDLDKNYAGVEEMLERVAKRHRV